MLLRVAEAALSEPSGTVRRVIFPVVGGEKTLKALAAEAAANEARYKARVRSVLRSSYSAHWRRMLAPLLKALEMKCNNTAYRPVMDAIDLLRRYLEQPLKEGAFFGPAETVPLGPFVTFPSSARRAGRAASGACDRKAPGRSRDGATWTVRQHGGESPGSPLLEELGGGRARRRRTAGGNVTTGPGGPSSTRPGAHRTPGGQRQAAALSGERRDPAGTPTAPAASAA
ncbi:hypothetical protein ACIQMV_22975 [Streptomyces sp. NPDC091412]|uniref:hypothetical protein n=1 Tax=Streptomyces sp. NPDC091412 TaxID=3366002 RepID=UPI0038145756